MIDLRKSAAPDVVGHPTWSLPTDPPDESANGFVNVITSPSEFDRGDFVFVLRMWMKVDPFSSSLNVSVRGQALGGSAGADRERRRGRVAGERRGSGRTACCGAWYSLRAFETGPLVCDPVRLGDNDAQHWTWSPPARPLGEHVLARVTRQKRR